ncbi:M48 family metalloprotease [Amaricoccus macauensis]|uniref:M48 family metalloprotease n=1 Tax=Amaricoccus macauensis TaxID=57001 RepID=UPI003C7B9FA0
MNSSDRTRTREGGLRRAISLIALTWLALLAFCLAPASALGLIRDAEIEETLDRISNPVFRAAALNPAIVRVYIVNDPEMNAFVAGGQNIFVHAGMLMSLETVDQLRAVIAHESGHIAGGHLARRNEALRGVRGAAVIGMLGAAAATLAGSPEAGIALASSSQQAINRQLLSHNRAEEAAADRMGLRYLAMSGSDPDAMLEVLRDFKSRDFQRSLSANRYATTHPIWSDRLSLIAEEAQKLPEGRAPDPELVYWHARMVAKLEGFLRPPRETLRRYPETVDTEPEMLARAVALHRLPDPDSAIAAVDTLIAMRPDDPYYLELKGQFLLESGRAEAAAEAYRTAVEAAPLEPQILGGLGRALLNMNTEAANREAAEKLGISARYDKANAGVLRDLALAEARLGNEGAAALATAERFVLMGDFQDAARNAHRAAQLLPKGSPGWQRAEDVITMTRRTRE